MVDKSSLGTVRIYRAKKRLKNTALVYTGMNYKNNQSPMRIKVYQSATRPMHATRIASACFVVQDLGGPQGIGDSETTVITGPKIPVIGSGDPKKHPLNLRDSEIL